MAKLIKKTLGNKTPAQKLGRSSAKPTRTPREKMGGGKSTYACK